LFISETCSGINSVVDLYLVWHFSHFSGNCDVIRFSVRKKVYLRAPFRYWYHFTVGAIISF